MKVIITGATGMVGAETVKQALLDQEITQVTAIVRKPLTTQHPKLNTVIHNDFLNWQSLTETFKQHEACIWCLGISQNKVKTETEYHTITFDYAINAAKAIVEANSDMAFLFLSGMGADSKEKSPTLFARIKGKTENALLRLSLKHLYIVRPGGIKPSQWNPNAQLLEKILYPFFPIFQLLIPSQMITAKLLAKVQLHIVKHGAPMQLMENKALLAFAESEGLTNKK